jgi:glycosyltransferase involved in cell wall biosynthesis
MRVLHICDYYQPLGGTEYYILNISRSLEASGHNVSVIYGKKNDEHSLLSERPSYYVPEILSFAKTLDVGIVNKLQHILELESPDIIYIHNISNYALATWLNKNKPLVRYIHDQRICCPKGDKMFSFQGRLCNSPCGVACVLNSYTRLCMPGFPLFWTRKFLHILHEMQAFRQIKSIVASAYMRQFLVSNRFSGNNIFVNPYFCSFEGYESQSFGNTILFIGRLERAKGVQYLIKSMKWWPGSLRLIIIGSGKYEHKLKQLSRKMKIDSRIDFLGALPNTEVAQYYAHCLCVAVPSIWGEPFGIIGLEAMCHSKPVIAFNVGGIPEWLVDGKTGFLVERKNIRELADKINLLFKDKNHAAFLGATARSYYESHFKQTLHIARLTEIFETVIQEYNSGT